MCVQYRIAVAHISGLCIFQIESINAYYKQGKLAKFRYQGQMQSKQCITSKKRNYDRYSNTPQDDICFKLGMNRRARD